MAALVTSVVLNHGDWEDVSSCVSSLRAQSQRDHRIVLVDNPTGAVAELSSRRSAVPSDLSTLQVLWNDRNLGYAGGNNVGIDRAQRDGSEFVLIVNPDATLNPDSLDRLLQTAYSIPDVGVLGPRVLYERPDSAKTPRIWSDGGRLDLEPYVRVRNIHDGDDPTDLPAEVVDVDFIPGACMLVRMVVFEEVGLLPEDYFLYFEETDFCLRARRAGFRCVVDRQAIGRHVKRSSGVVPEAYYVYYYPRSLLLFARRHQPQALQATRRDLEGRWISNWRKRIAATSPTDLEWFERLVDQAVGDGLRGRVGPVNLPPRPTSLRQSPDQPK